MGYKSDEEVERLLPNDIPKWDRFTNTIRKAEVGSTARNRGIEISVKLLKIFTYAFVFTVILAGGIVSKGTLLFMTSQFKNVSRQYCNKDYDSLRKYTSLVPNGDRAQWMWMVIFAFFVPEVGTFLRSLRILVFKKWTLPTWADFLPIFITETMSAIGSAILVFGVLPELNLIKGAMLTYGVCFIPVVLSFLSRNPTTFNSKLLMFLDVLSILSQIWAFVAWPLIDSNNALFLIPVCCVLISAGWWENFISSDSKIPLFKYLARDKKHFKNSTYFSYFIISIWKCGVFLLSTVIILGYSETLQTDFSFLFDTFNATFEDRFITITEEAAVNTLGVDISNTTTIRAFPTTAIYVFLINISTTYLCYIFGKFACRIMIQSFSFAFALSLVPVGLIASCIAFSGMYTRDECAFWGSIPPYLGVSAPKVDSLWGFIKNEAPWVWLLWLLSQAWITLHIWSPKCSKLSNTEKLFIRPMYDAFLIDQSLALNRRRDDDYSKVNEQENIKQDDTVTRIYSCATMWHETKEEMMEFFKSIMRLDEDYSARCLSKKYLNNDPPHFYELETNIYFDDAFLRVSQTDEDPMLNEFVIIMLDSLDDSLSEVHGVEVKIQAPKIVPTPYGGRLEWTLPGNSKMYAHLKDKKKIRAKKRWSQCMYMYQLLGLRLMDDPTISKESKAKIAENTFILALDGDIDFNPEAIHLLVENMKKNSSLGAACGRIHPVGAGAMAWYQIFEYAVGHWLQKATEHVLGCVLCSPGCFSLFRGSALMDDCVMNKYTTRATEARHYVQYDQGEDRWLCTLLLQQGYRVEYAAASDAYTHCPEGFNEFYNQRRRWMPSTMANILDLLTDYRNVVKNNDNISLPYIFYQTVLLVGTVVGPGTIFLMLVGSFVAAFGLDQWHSFYWNAIPILLFSVICATCKSDTQLFFAGIISAFYGLVMMAVFIGVVLQIQDDGWLAPSTLFFMFTAGEMIVAAFIHPQEFYCLKYGIIYYVTVPSMYMLLVIYSVFNMNNVSWGTREVSVVKAPPQKNVTIQEQAKTDPKNRVLAFFGSDAKDDAGSMEFSVSGLFKCFLCTHRKNTEENEQLRAIQTNLMLLTQKLDTLERLTIDPSLHRSESGLGRRKTTLHNRRTTMITVGSDKKASVASKHTESHIEPDIFEENEFYDDPDFDEMTDIGLEEDINDVVSNSWMYMDELSHGKTDVLDDKEETFWNKLIEKYLHPIDDTENKEKIQKDLKDLRDQITFSFFMLNSLFVLVIFLLTLKKDTVHINWPFNAKVNFTYLEEPVNTIYLYKDYLHLEPIGFVFMLFFASLLIAQSIGMFMHRFGTYCQIMTNTDVTWNIFKSKTHDNNIEELSRYEKVKFAKRNQALKVDKKEHDIQEHVSVKRKRTVHNLATQPSQQVPTFNLEEAFLRRLGKRLQNPDENTDPIMRELPRKTIQILKNNFVTENARKKPHFVDHPVYKPKNTNFAADNDAFEDF